MGAIRKPRCQTGRLNAAERRDARERRSNVDVEKAMEGFFNNMLDLPLGQRPRQGPLFFGCHRRPRHNFSHGAFAAHTVRVVIQRTDVIAR